MTWCQRDIGDGWIKFHLNVEQFSGFFFGTISMSEGLSVLAYGYGFLGGFAGAQPVVTQ